MIKHFVFFFLLFGFFSINAIEPNDPIISRCFVTRTLPTNIKIPSGELNMTNNARKLVIEDVIVNENQLKEHGLKPSILHVKLLTNDCIPIANAKVNLWYSYKDNIITATTFSDNLGNANFYLYLSDQIVKSGYNKQEVNLNIYSNELNSNLSTKVKFKNEYNNLPINKYKEPVAYLDTQQNINSLEWNYYLHITLSQENNLKTY